MEEIALLAHKNALASLAKNTPLPRSQRMLARLRAKNALDTSGFIDRSTPSMTNLMMKEQ
jgi:hypothetical protein